MPRPLPALLALCLLAGCPRDPEACLPADIGPTAGADAAAEAGPDAGQEPPDAAPSGPDAQAEPPDGAEPADAAPEPPDAGAPDAAPAPIPLRYLAINVGNASVQYGCWEYKICRAEDVRHVRDYIALWRPDVVMVSEVLREAQLLGAEANGPLLPPGYDGVCGKSLDRDTGLPAAFDADRASHEHECIAWKASRLALVPGSVESAYGRNDAQGKADCAYDFTGIRARLVVDGRVELTAVAVHPDSKNAGCRAEEIGRYWSRLATGDRVIIGGDWNTESLAEIAPPGRFRVNYSRGAHWDLATHPEEYSASYALGAINKQLDHAFSTFGPPCVDCGGVYHTFDLTLGSVLGGYDGHPRADQGDGLDHRQVLVDAWIAP